jgi:DNA-binding IscR family transcriptional regulator
MHAKDQPMRNDSRLSRMLHVLLHMARHDGPMTSEAIGMMLGTNPVVVRRTLAGLRDAGYVRSDKGHGGGWAIACDLERVSLLDVEMAGEVSHTRLLLGFGLRQFSMHPALLLPIKQQVLRATLSDAEALASRILRTDDPEKSRQLLGRLNA